MAPRSLHVGPSSRRVSRWQAGTTLGPWRLVRPVASGEWSDVYLAAPLDSTTESAADYAIKVLSGAREGDPQAITLLQREAYFARSVSHPHLVSVLSAHVDRPPFFLVMPFLRGANLRSVLDGRPLPMSKALWIARQAAEGLAAVHAKGWIHGDLKPDNIHLSHNGHVTLCDLGFARERSDHGSRSSHVLCGTPAYLAPEAFDERRGETPAIDVYSLGITLAEMLLGVRPFAERDSEELVIAHREERPWSEKSQTLGIPPAVVRLVRRMLAKEPLRRPTSQELVSMLIDLEIDTLG